MSLMATLDDLSPRRFERTAEDRLIHYDVKTAVVCVGAPTMRNTKPALSGS
jgi:hypothetical protein